MKMSKMKNNKFDAFMRHRVFPFAPDAVTGYTGICGHCCPCLNGRPLEYDLYNKAKDQ
jgi:hypothetical protein